jgi:competence protein ComEA
MQDLKSHLIFNRSQRGGILFLVSFIVVLLNVNYFYDFSDPTLIDISSSEVKALQKEIDSLRFAETEARKPKLYPFNPNYITDFKAYTLGLSPDEFDRLKSFRSNNQWINSAADFKRITKASDSVMAIIGPFFKFPDWVTNPKPKANNYKKNNDLKGFTEKSFAQKIDLNEASEKQLQEVSGIGEALSNRIVSYREKLGGFSADVQLQGVWGLNDEVVKRTLNVFTVKTPKTIRKIDVNKASASDIATIPGVSFDLAKQIWEFRILRERIEDFSELEKIEALSPIKLKLIQLYLSIE